MPISIATNIKRRRKLGLAEGLWPFFDTVAEAEYFLPMFENGLL